MDVQDGDARPDAEEPVGLAAHRTAPGRTVFTEPGNPDAWIATDYTIDCDD